MGEFSAASHVFLEVGRRGDPRGWFMAAQAHEAEEELGHALEYYTRADALPEAQFRKFRVLQALGRSGDALQQLRQSVHSSWECATTWDSTIPTRSPAKTALTYWRSTSGATTGTS
ncbi:hypothetical protein GCM10010401_19860 [Rarobacter faecitabidus]|uniref:hypothetical protein n=1 Tax=Rarobacter faecitabidus TaxID=13243 RepID=UPI00114FA360|nr:hypothetical protein [Rarobacter faecitabidus]